MGQIQQQKVKPNPEKTRNKSNDGREQDRVARNSPEVVASSENEQEMMRDSGDGEREAVKIEGLRNWYLITAGILRKRLGTQEFGKADD